MKELVRTTNPALLTYVEALLKEAGLAYYIADSGISIIATFPRRVLVNAEDEIAARRLLEDANLGAELKTHK